LNYECLGPGTSILFSEESAVKKSSNYYLSRVVKLWRFGPENIHSASSVEKRTVQCTDELNYECLGPGIFMPKLPIHVLFTPD
jgi:hypothetical protein